MSEKQTFQVGQRVTVANPITLPSKRFMGRNGEVVEREFDGYEWVCFVEFGYTATEPFFERELEPVSEPAAAPTVAAASEGEAPYDVLYAHWDAKSIGNALVDVRQQAYYEDELIDIVRLAQFMRAELATLREQLAAANAAREAAERERDALRAELERTLKSEQKYMNIVADIEDDARDGLGEWDGFRINAVLLKLQAYARIVETCEESENS